MAVFKGDNSTISLVVEDQGWGKKPSTYTGGKFFQNNDGTFNATRGSLQSEARTPNAELAGVRLGNKNVAGSFPVEIDPENYNKLLESVFYGRFVKEGVAQVNASVNLTATKKYELTIPMTSQKQTALKVKVGNMYRLYGITESTLTHLNNAVVVLKSKTNAAITLYCAEQVLDTVNVTGTPISIEPVETLRPAKQSRSFNAEETLYGEDGQTTARFMTAGAVATSAAFDMPSDGTVKTTFSLIGSGKTASKEYQKFDPALTNGDAAHQSPAAHKKYDPMVLQDGKMISNETDTLCQLISGTITIENGTETHFVGCSYDAIAAVSGKLGVTLAYEALFQSEDDYIAFESEQAKSVMVKLKDRTTDKCLVIYMPSVRATAYNINNSTGLVTASITSSAVVDPEAVNSIIVGSYYG